NNTICTAAARRDRAVQKGHVRANVAGGTKVNVGSCHVLDIRGDHHVGQFRSIRTELQDSLALCAGLSWRDDFIAGQVSPEIQWDVRRCRHCGWTHCERWPG